MKSLKNINAQRLVTAQFNEDVQVGDTFHTKGQYITDFGRTWTVTRVTPKQVEATFQEAWFPVHKKTSFGRLAKGQTEHGQWLLAETNKSQAGKLTQKFWRTGQGVGTWNDTQLVVVA